MLRRWFFTGLAVLVPVTVTIYIIVALFNFADGILGQHINRYLSLYFGYRIPGLGLIFSLFIIVFAGMVASIFRFRFFRWLEKVFLQNKLIGKIYNPIKRVVNFTLSRPEHVFKKTVLVEYPRKGVYSIGFVTNQASEKIKPDKNKKMLNLFISSSPSPLTGFFLLVPEEDVIFLDVTAEQAMRLLVSGGMVNPEDMIDTDR
jgi:uncharacterized membrane protein